MKKTKNKRWKVVKNKYVPDKYEVYRVSNYRLKRSHLAAVVVLSFIGMCVFSALDSFPLFSACCIAFMVSFVGMFVWFEDSFEHNAPEYKATSLDEAFEWTAEKELETLEQTEWYV